MIDLLYSVGRTGDVKPFYLPKGDEYAKPDYTMQHLTSLALFVAILTLVALYFRR